MGNLINNFASNELILACATCMGDDGSVINQAAGYAIAFMLIMLTIVLGCLVKFMRHLSKADKGVSATS